MTLPKSSFIDGEQAAVHAEDLHVVDPARGGPISALAVASPDDVDRAVAVARRAQREWRKTTPGERAAVLWRLADLVSQQAAELAALESQQTGSSLRLRTGDVEVVEEVLRYYAGLCRRLDGVAANEYLPDHTSYLRREPVGVIAQVTPWNYPLAIAVNKLAPALATGNAVVAKPSPLTPLSALRLAELAVEAGLPAGILNVVVGGRAIGETLVAHDSVDAVSFTGSTRTGRAVAQLAAGRRVTLELGGKAPFVVLRDADIEASARGAVVAAFVNAGQDCMAATRVYVEEAVADVFLERLVALTEQVDVGDPSDERTDMGSLISREHLEHVASAVDRAVDGGATVLTGGERVRVAGLDDGAFYAPSVLLTDDQRSELVQEELFGPVLAVLRVADADQALAWANDSPYGLVGSVWSRDVVATGRFARELECGTVWINDHLPLPAEMPHGGFGRSGYGKEGSHLALEACTRVKAVVSNNKCCAVQDWHAGVAVLA